MKNGVSKEFVPQIVFVQPHIQKNSESRLIIMIILQLRSQSVSLQQQISFQRRAQLLMGVCSLCTQSSKYTQRPINKIKKKITVPTLAEKQHTEKYVFNSSPHTQSCQGTSKCLANCQYNYIYKELTRIDLCLLLPVCLLPGMEKPGGLTNRFDGHISRQHAVWTGEVALFGESAKN